MRIIVKGEERVVDRVAATAAGYVEIDLSDDWTPKIFEPRLDQKGKPAHNHYRKTFIDLANDRTDGDGLPLRRGERNYLEVFGIPPSLGILRDRFVNDAKSECLKKVKYDVIGSLTQLTNRRKSSERKHRRRVRSYKKSLKRAMKRAKVTRLEEFEPKKKGLKKKLKYVLEHEREMKVLAQIEARLDCDGHMHRRYRHKRGRMDRGLRNTVRRFQRKHMIYEHTNLKNKTMVMLAKPPIQTNYDALTRVMRERLVAATGILEDGSYTEHTGKTASYTGKDGKTHQVRNLVDEFTRAALVGLDMGTPEKALAFFQRHPRSAFKSMRYGVKLPKKPEYYSGQMDLKLVIDRGSVFYGAPFKENGKKRYHRRKKMPRATLYVTYRDQKIPLVNWPTTIGGWRKEQAKNGYVYMKYKGSDVGNRVIRNIIAGPTWIAPESTPLKSLAKYRKVNGVKQGVVNYNDLGPGYLSAYGLVAGYFVIAREGRKDLDRGIRAHGSSNYMSIFSESGYSHGCHRMMNHHAVRMYGFILDHRNHVIAGDQSMGYKRQFLYQDEVYEIRIPSRGFQYTLDPPMPVTVLRGTVFGNGGRKPVGWVKIPQNPYPKSLPGEKKEEPGKTKDGDAPKKEKAK